MMYSSSDTTITADMDQLAISSRRTGINNPQTFSSSVHDPLLADLVHSATPGHHSRNPQLQHPGTGLASSSTDENSFGLGITNAPPGTSTPRDAWEGQGEFPLRLEKVSHSAVPVLGGVQLIFTGANFRDGVQAVFECPQLGSAVRPKIITPTVLRDTRMVANAPNLLDWWALLHKEPSHNRGSLTLSVTLTCAGVRNNEDQGTVFTLVATEGMLALVQF
ncbi:hypothetical protein BGW38_000287 [Lunasporangiospora selenospora]|uniref:Uncharacterized protein n=1 Tax=Lunasporangiospora selenospora TaxID=979761 RepID=A0A9P6FVJ5_9FUNG|nr:hypothetical protein BGW38_000287 [Lunasporangiospora selenospora]